MSLDDQRLEGLIEESEDLQADAVRDVRRGLPGLAELGHERAQQPVDPDQVRHVNDERRRILRNGGYGLSGFAAKGLLATGFGAAVTALVSQPASADTPLDIQILQTASSLEVLAVATYKAALGLPFISGQATVKAFAETTMKQHGEHRDAFQSQTTSLGGKKQADPNPKYLQVVTDATPGLTDASKVVDLAIALETVATETYLADLALLDSSELRSLMASIMGVESQHLATLRAVGALLAGDAVDLIAIPTDVAKLPAAAGSVSFPQAFEPVTMASPPEEGAVK